MLLCAEFSMALSSMKDVTIKSRKLGVPVICSLPENFLGKLKGA